MRSLVYVSSFAIVFWLGFLQVLAQQSDPMPGRGPYGWPMMTEDERHQYMSDYCNAPTDEERERIRRLHHDRVKDLARERGIGVPEEPGPGYGMGMMCRRYGFEVPKEGN